MGNQALVMKALEGVENARPTLKLNICIEAGKTMGGDGMEPIAQSRLSRNGPAIALHLIAGARHQNGWLLSVPDFTLILRLL
jgi:hypothetical protein